VNCAIDKAACSQNKIESYPTFKLFVEGTPLEYDGEHTAKALYTFVVDNLPSQVVAIRRGEQLRKFVVGDCAKGWKFCVILFTSKYETSALYKSLSFTFENKVAMGEVRASNDGLASVFGVRTYPALVLVCGGDIGAYDVYHGELKEEAIREHLSNFKKKSKCSHLHKRSKRSRSALNISEEELSRMRVADLRTVLEIYGTKLDALYRVE
jgi:hypothetical protein